MVNHMGLKKIGTDQLRLGMFVHELCGSWLDSPIWHRSVLLDDPTVMKKIQESTIAEVWIDISKGIDVGQQQVEMAGGAPESAATSTIATASAPQRTIADTVRTSMAEEMDRASLVIEKSKRAIHSMFNELRMGKTCDVSGAMPLVEEIANSVLRNPDALIGLVRLKKADDYTYMHSIAVCALMIGLARQLNIDEDTTRELGLAGLMHDLGKMHVPSNILNKPGKLSDDEFAAIRRHPSAGANILREVNDISGIVFDVVLHHHEKLDGTGYPDRLAGDQVSLHARMGAICDIYDAITSNRPYKQGWCPAESLRRMAEWCGGHLDRAVFQAFVKSIGIYPTGTLVRLASGRLGVVVEQHADRQLLKPKVRVFFSTKSKSQIVPELVDLGAAGVIDDIVSVENTQQWKLTDINRYWT